MSNGFPGDADTAGGGNKLGEQLHLIFYAFQSSKYVCCNEGEVRGRESRGKRLTYLINSSSLHHPNTIA